MEETVGPEILAEFYDPVLNTTVKGTVTFDEGCLESMIWPEDGREPLYLSPLFSFINGLIDFRTFMNQKDTAYTGSEADLLDKLIAEHYLDREFDNDFEGLEHLRTVFRNHADTLSIMFGNR